MKTNRGLTSSIFKLLSRITDRRIDKRIKRSIPSIVTHNNAVDVGVVVVVVVVVVVAVDVIVITVVVVVKSTR